MTRLYLYAAGITASLTILLTAAAAQDAALLKQAQEIFQPLPKDLASAEVPTARERVELGRLVISRRFTELTLVRKRSVCSSALTRAMLLQC